MAQSTDQPVGQSVNLSRSICQSITTSQSGAVSATNSQPIATSQSRQSITHNQSKSINQSIRVYCRQERVPVYSDAQW
eukprot:1460912-Lingulodinium_polyedra.AAC.1